LVAIDIAELDAAETRVAISPPLALAPLLALELFGYKPSFCAFLVLRKPRFMMDGIGVVVATLRVQTFKLKRISGQPLLNE